MIIIPVQSILISAIVVVIILAVPATIGTILIQYLSGLVLLIALLTFLYNKFIKK